MDKQPVTSETTKVNVLRRKVILFDMVFGFIADKGQLQTQILQRKLQLLAEEKGKSFEIVTYTSNQVDTYGKEANVILLTPTFAYAKGEIEKKFPTTPVFAISKKDYGMLNVERLYEEIITVLK